MTTTNDAALDFADLFLRDPPDSDAMAAALAFGVCLRATLRLFADVELANRESGQGLRREFSRNVSALIIDLAEHLTDDEEGERALVRAATEIRDALRGRPAMH